MKIQWESRYSKTDDPDNSGRWARVGWLSHKSNDPFKAINIAWIQKYKSANDVDYVYTSHLYIGQGNINKAKSLEEAKKWAEDKLEEMVNDYFI